MNSESIRTKLKECWEKFLATSDCEELVAILVEYPELTKQACAHEYPSVHRIKDVFIGRYFRVCRCVLCDERLMFLPIDTDRFDEHEGVPYWLRGERLKKWFRDEDSDPAKDEQDWSEY